MLATGIVIDLAAYLADVQAVNILSTREIAPVLPFGAVLAGRLLGERVLAARVAGARPGFAIAAAGACYAGMLGFAAAQPAAAPQYADLAGWLSAHHLTSGVSGYSQANIVTVESSGAISLVLRGFRGRQAAGGGDVRPAGPDLSVPGLHGHGLE